MDLSEAMKSHAEWNIKFRNAISKHDTVDIAIISADNCCALGMWLHGEGQIKYGGSRSHADCVAKHALFHQEAGKVAQAINEKKYEEAKTMIGPNSPFFIASNNVIVAIGALKRDSDL